MVSRYNDKSSTVRKYTGLELYLLPPSLFPNKPLSTMNQWYLDFSNAPIASPLKRPLQIELYNNTYFPCNSMHISKPSRNTPSCQLDTSTFNYICNTRMPSNTTLFEASNNDIPLIELSSACDHILPINFSTDLSNQLFFIPFTLDEIMLRRWYLIQVDIEFTV